VCGNAVCQIVQSLRLKVLSGLAFIRLYFRKAQRAYPFARARKQF
jgi:hypothetical protein